MAMDIEELKLLIRSLLITYKEPPSIDILRRDFRGCEGKDIPFTELGYSNILNFLHSLKDTVKVLPDHTLKVVAPEEQQHLIDLVRRQKSQRPKKKLPAWRNKQCYSMSPARKAQDKHSKAQEQELCDTYFEKTSHAILLLQPGSLDTRIYSDYESVDECMEVLCKIFEEHLKKHYPNIPCITYDISQLFDFLDQLTDLSCLVYQRSTNTYEPCNKDWIKEKLYTLLKWTAST